MKQTLEALEVTARPTQPAPAPELTFGESDLGVRLAIWEGIDADAAVSNGWFVHRIVGVRGDGTARRTEHEVHVEDPRHPASEDQLDLLEIVDLDTSDYVVLDRIEPAPANTLAGTAFGKPARGGSGTPAAEAEEAGRPSDVHGTPVGTATDTTTGAAASPEVGRGRRALRLVGDAIDESLREQEGEQEADEAGEQEAETCHTDETGQASGPPPEPDAPPGLFVDSRGNVESWSRPAALAASWVFRGARLLKEIGDSEVEMRYGVVVLVLVSLVAPKRLRRVVHDRAMRQCRGRAVAAARAVVAGEVALSRSPSPFDWRARLGAAVATPAATATPAAKPGDARRGFRLSPSRTPSPSRMPMVSTASV